MAGDDAASPATALLCPGTPAPPAGYATCRTSAECADAGNGNYACASSPPQNQPTCTGGCPSPHDQCTVDSECPAGAVCSQPTLGGCCPAGKTCAPACTATSCGPGESCAVSGHCKLTPCTDGFACGAGYLCAPSRPPSQVDAHGCANASCVSDGYVCGSGLLCQAGPQADPHGCSAISCADGFACWNNYDCVPTSGAWHHCVRRSCKVDADCDCGACVLGSCENSLFICVPFALGSVP
jgi:hypothetical protein